MKKRIISMLLAFVMMVSIMPMDAFASTDSLQSIAACATEGCEYVAGHEGNCSNFVACETEGCEYAAGHEGNCSNFTACETEGCEYEAGHEGNCSNFVACETEGCEYAAGHEGNCSNYKNPEEQPQANEPAMINDEVTEISDLAGLANIKKGGNFKLVADITLDSSWDTSLGGRKNKYSKYSGPFTLDGNGHTINLNGQKSYLLNNLLDEDRIVNLIVTGETSNQGLSSAGIVSTCYGIIRNCVSSVEFKLMSGLEEYASGGGIAVSVSAGGSITNCYSEAKLPVDNDQFGKIYSSNSGTVDNCYTDADNIYDVIASLNASAKENGDMRWGLNKDGLLVPGGTGTPDSDNEGGNEGGDQGNTTPPEGGNQGGTTQPAEGYTAIRTQEDLKNLSKAGKYQLMNDIVLDGWTALELMPSDTEFNGNGYTITLDGTPMFVTAKGKVVNLKLAGQVTETANKNTGALCQSLSGGTVHNCISDVTVTYSGKSNSVYIGQLIGTFNSSATVTNCLILGSVTQGVASCYGALGAAFNNPKEFSNCVAVGYTILATKEGYPTNSTISGSNCTLVATSEYKPSDYLKSFNDNRGEALEWVIKDNALSLKNTTGGSQTPTDPDATETELQELSNAIASAENTVNNTKVYTKETLDAFNTALTAAKNISGVDKPKQSAVVKATSDLNAAKSDLTEKNLAPVQLSSDVTVINTADELASMQEGKHYKLGKNIILPSTWRIMSTAMNCVLDGNGYIIQMSGYPVWTSIGANGVVQNLGIVGTAQNLNNDTGAFAKDCEGLIVNCWSSAQVTSEGNSNYKKNTGGFVANLKSGGAIINSYVSGVVAMKGETGEGVQGALAGTTEANTMIKDGYWLNTVGEYAIGSGDAIINGCYSKTRAEFYDDLFIQQLNSNKGENGKEWTVNKDGWPHLGEAGNFEPDAPIELVYTPNEGYGPKNPITFTSETGLSLSLAEILNGEEFNPDKNYVIGKFSYPSYEGEVVFEAQYAPDGLGHEKLAVDMTTGELTFWAADSIEVVAYNKNSHIGNNYYSEILARFTVTVSDIEPEEIRMVPSGKYVSEESGAYKVKGSGLVTLNPEMKVDGKWMAAPSSLFTFTKSDNVRVQGGNAYATAPGEMIITATYNGISGTVKINSEYVPVTSISPAPNGTYVIHGRNANTQGSSQFLDLTLSHNAGTVVVQPENASYRDNWTLTTSDESIAKYGTSYMMAIIPVKAGEVTLTATSTDPKLTQPVTGTSKIKLEYFNPLTKVEITNQKITVKENESVELPLTFEGQKNSDGYHVSEPDMKWTYSGDGKVKIVRKEPLGVIIGEEGSKEYCIANDKYILNGLSEGTVTVTGTPFDTTGNAKPITFTVTVEAGAALTPADNDRLIADGISGAQKYLIENAPEKYEYGYEWDIFSLVRSGKDLTEVQKKEYLDSVKGEVKNLTKPTDLARVALALRTLGENPTKFAGSNLIEKLYSSDNIKNTTSNEPIWALIALDLDDYKTPSDAKWTREKLITEILTYQNENGGVGLSSEDAPDVDMTAMAIQALAPYYTSNSTVKSAVDKAFGYLKDRMNDQCGFGSAEADAQVIVALSALNRDILAEENGFVKNVATNIITNIVSYQDSASGGFKYQDKISKMPTIQALYGLESYRRFDKKANSLYDLSDIKVAAESYKITAGDNSTWQKGSTDEITIKCNGKVDKFEHLTIDGKKVSDSYYTVKSVSSGIAVTLKANYLQTLLEGKHSVTLVFSDGDATAVITIEPSDKEAIDNVKDLIDAIGTVTKDSEPAIEKAEKAYDDLTAEQKKLFNETYPGFYSKLVQARKDFEMIADKITVTVEIYGDYIHDSDKDGIIHSLGNGLTLWAKGNVLIKKDSTVLQALKALLDEKGMSCKVTHGGNYIASITKGSVTLGEFTNGDYSGWYYNLNGSRPGIGVGENTVKDGDKIVFHYTDNYTGISPATAIKKVEALIDAIDKNVTLNSKDQIIAARIAYNKLSREQQKMVSNYDVLLAAEKKLNELHVEEVEKLIDEIGKVTLSSGDKIEKALEAYNALSYAQQKEVSNSDQLFAAKDKYNKLRAEEVEDLIGRIDPEITLDSKEAIAKARKAYDKLSDEQKALVGKEYVERLKAAELELALLKATDEDKKKAQDVIDLIDRLGDITLDSEDAIKRARKAYDSLTDIQKALVTNYEELVDAERVLNALKTFAKFENVYTTTGEYLEKLGVPNVGSIGGEWMVLGLARSNREVSEQYYENVISYVKQNIDENERLHHAKSTENSRLILALTAIGKDVTNVDGHNLLNGLNDLDYVYKQGINGPIYALIAFDSGNYPTPDNGDVSRETLLQKILDNQLPDGGWSLSGDTADADMTAMALQALARYYSSNEEIAFAVERGLSVLSEMQNEDGSYSGVDGKSSESIAQVLVALTALGIDPETDERFVKNDSSVLDALLEFYVSGGGFKHLMNGKLDGMATEQAYYALVSYYRYLMKQTSLYDMTDMIDMGAFVIEKEDAEAAESKEQEEIMEDTETTAPVDDDEDGNSWWIAAIAPVIIAAAGAAIVMSRKKKSFKE